MLAGSGHIAGVVNPPAPGKYQYWTNPGAVETLDEFVAGASETPGQLVAALDRLAAQRRTPPKCPPRASACPASKGDPVIEDAPGRYVKAR